MVMRFYFAKQALWWSRFGPGEGKGDSIAVTHSCLLKTELPRQFSPPNWHNTEFLAVAMKHKII